MREVSTPIVVIISFILFICFSIPIMIGSYDQHIRYRESLKEHRPKVEIKRSKDEYEDLDV